MLEPVCDLGVKAVGRSSPQQEQQQEQQAAPLSLSFQGVVAQLAEEQKQNDVSLSFYFICLLHLANEKVTFLFIVQIYFI